MKNINFRNLPPSDSILYPLLVFVVSFPILIIIQSSFVLHIMIMTMLFISMAYCWSLVSGYAGQLSLGHSAFIGIGAYTSTLLFLRFNISPWLGLIAGGILAGIFAALIGYPSFRLRGPFFTLVTIAFSEMLRITAINWRSLTGGSAGIFIPFRQGFANIIFLDKTYYGILILGLMVFTIIITLFIQKSKFGYYLLAIRENEDAASALGINTTKYKTYVFMLSASLMAVTGSFFAQYLLIVDPYYHISVNLSIMVALIGIIGGLGTLWGPMIGGVLVIPLSELLRSYLAGGPLRGLHLLLYGLILIIVVIINPHGLNYSLEKFFVKLRRGGKKIDNTSIASSD